VIDVSGHRLGTTEAECALMSHPAVREAVAIGGPYSKEGAAIVACVVLKAGKENGGALAVSDQVYLMDTLPKTRSGKIMRRVMRAVVSGEDIGDVTTLEETSAVDEVRAWITTVGKG